MTAELTRGRSTMASMARTPKADHEAIDDLGRIPDVPVFTCSTCGRTDLPEAGDWDPPICLECDAAINEDALREQGDSDDER